MNTIECRDTFVAIKLHFTSSYDYFKYRGKVRQTSVPPNIFHQKLARKYSTEDFIGLCASNLLENQKLWIRDLTQSPAETVYLRWLKKRDGMSHVLDTDFTKIETFMALNQMTVDRFFQPDGTKYPPLLKMVLGKQIERETFLCFDHLFGLEKQYRSYFKNDPVLENFFRLTDKYRPFIMSQIVSAFEKNRATLASRLS